MNILVISPIFPYPQNNGGQIRVCQIVTNLAKRHSVSLLCFESEKLDDTVSGVDFFEKLGIQVKTVPRDTIKSKGHKRLKQFLSLLSHKSHEYQKFYSLKMQDEINKLLNSNVYEKVIVEFSQMGYYEYNTSVPKFVDLHNIESMIMQRTYEQSSSFRKLLAYVEWRKYRNHEVINCRKFTARIVTSTSDAKALNELATDLDSIVIPNGVDTEYFKSTTMVDNSTNIVFVGTINYFPNIDGLNYFLNHIWPLVKCATPNAKLTIVGRNPPSAIKCLPERDISIAVTGTVDDVRIYYESAAAVVVPLKVSGGTRLKVLEAMAMEKAIVSTSIGAEGIDVTDGQNILLRDSYNSFAEAIVELISNSQLQKRIGKNGRVLVENRYNWSSLVEKLEQHIQDTNNSHTKTTH